MSNVKVNDNTYNGVTSVKLPLADGSGFATYAEGAVTDDVTNSILSGTLSGDYGNADITELNLSVLNLVPNIGTLSFPNVVTVFGGQTGGYIIQNLLLPKATKIDYRNNTFVRFGGTVIGVLDLSGVDTTTGSLNFPFMGATIGTLKLGAMKQCNGMFQNATITNLIWTHPNLTADYMGGGQGLGSTGAKITNAYVPDSLYDEIKVLMDAGTLTTVTNLFKISEWSDN